MSKLKIKGSCSPSYTAGGYHQRNEVILEKIACFAGLDNMLYIFKTIVIKLAAMSIMGFDKFLQAIEVGRENFQSCINSSRLNEIFKHAV